MNSGFYNNLDINFENACLLSEKLFSHEELLDLLKNGNIPQKQIAALKFDYVKTKEDAEILLHNLTGCDGKIREAVANSVHRILAEDKNSRGIFAPVSSGIFADASIDINANICRLIVDSACLLIDFEEFSKLYSERLIKFAKDALSELDKFIFRDKKYVINKQIFKLYWCLEGLAYFRQYANQNDLFQILKKCAEQKEYTIREKTAQIVVNSTKYHDLYDKLKNDENYYVRNVFISS